jgi:hypothetical protein
MRANIGQVSMIVLSCIAASACAGGGGSPLASIPSVPPGPPAPPSVALGTPMPNNAAPLVAGALTPSPALIQAAPASKGFGGISTETAFPMLSTVADPGTFEGNAAGTAAGGTITFDKGGAGLGSIGLTLNFQVPTGPYLSNSIVSNGADLDYTRFGYWWVDDGIDGPFAHGVWNVGFATPQSAIPTTGQASYTGHTTGLYDESHPCGCQNDFTVAFSGDMSLTANFGARTLSGSFTNLSITGGTVLQPTLNDVNFSASIDSSRNWFSGVTGVVNQPAGQQAFTPDASGSITGMFYGPSANEVGGVWTLSDSIRRLIGSFGGKQH